MDNALCCINSFPQIDRVPIMSTRLITSLVLSCACVAQYPGKALSDYVHANERFGRKLLLTLHEAEPDMNIAISPFPLSQAFGALTEGTSDRTTLLELLSVFEWQDQPFRGVASRMLSARIPSEKMPPRDQTQRPAPKRPPAPIVEPTKPFVPLSQSTIFLYHGKGLLTDRFTDKASFDYGIQFQEAKPGEPLVPPDPTARELYGPNGGVLNFSITSFTDLRTAWIGELFKLSSPKLSFALRTGGKLEVDQMVSDIRKFRHASNEEFEAVELSTGEAYLLVVLPAVGKDIVELEKQIAGEKMDLETILKSELGDVTLPIFRIQTREDLRPPLQRLGLKKVFSDPESQRAMVNTPLGANLVTALQQVDLDVDQWGIKARAVTFIGGVLGGIMGGSMSPPDQPFHMVVNRPFLFFIRDNATDSLLFVGAEMNPTKR
ncbi:MAG TPA: serpin family protein [Candidatus Acidoferrum sp.]